MCDKIWLTLQVQCLSLTLLMIQILSACFWFFGESKTNILCKQGEHISRAQICKQLVDIMLFTVVSINVPGCCLLSIAAAWKQERLLVTWQLISILQIPIAFFGSFWVLLWYRMMDPIPALIFAGLVLIYGSVILKAWVSTYDLLYTIRLSREQHRVTALVVVLYNI